MDNESVKVSIGQNKYLTEINAGKHQFHADEPYHVGGTDQGPTPYDMLLASLGACTAITLRMYADRKSWPLNEVIVHLKHHKNHITDAKNCDGEEVKMDLIVREIEFKGDLDEKQVSRLMQIADKCPVHKTLTQGLRIQTSKVNME